MKKIKVRIALAVNHNADWSAIGWSIYGDRPTEDEMMDRVVDDVGERRYWIEAEVEVPTVPEPEVVQGVVVEDAPGG